MNKFHYLSITLFVLFVIVIIISVIASTGGESDAQIIEKFSNWEKSELVNMEGGTLFTIEKLNKPVLVETFSLGCNTCKEQHDQMALVEGNIISLDTSSGGDAMKLKEYINNNSYTWTFTIAPAWVKQSLISDFGPGVLDSRFIIVCGGKYTLLDPGIKYSGELKNILATC